MRACRRALRTTPLSCGNRAGTNQVDTPRREAGQTYTTASHRRAIQRACVAAEVPSWHPHQLRHNVGTLVRKQFGIEVAQAVLSHSTLTATQVYAEVNRERARMAIREVG